MYIKHFLNTSVSSVKAQNIFALVIILFFAGVNILSVRRGYSQTKDEDKHYQYGENILAGNSSRFDDSKMLISALNALPAKITQLTASDRLIQIGSRFYIARSVTILFSCFVAFLVFYWARALYDFIPAVFSLLLYILDPNIIAHSQLVTTDIYAVGSIAFAFYCLWRFANVRNMHNGLWCAFALGMSQIAKYTAIALFPLFLISLIIYDFFVWIRAERGKGIIQMLTLRYIKYAVFTIIVAILIINVGFLFNRTFTPFSEYTFRSKLFEDIQNNVPFLSNFLVPVPYPYLQGLDLIRYNEQSGASYGNIYLLGHINSQKGFPGYFIVASILKLPIATQIILMLSLIIYFARRERRENFFKNDFFLLIPVVFYTVYFNFFYNTHIGIRYFLPVFPLLYIFSGSLFVGWRGFSLAQKSLSWGMIAYLFISVFSYSPYFLSYFNELVWDRTQAYKYLADSNIDWGQSQNDLWEYISNNLEAVYLPDKIQSGRLVISVNDLVGKM